MNLNNRKTEIKELRKQANKELKQLKKTIRALQNKVKAFYDKESGAPQYECSTSAEVDFIYKGFRNFEDKEAIQKVAMTIKW